MRLVSVISNKPNTENIFNIYYFKNLVQEVGLLNATKFLLFRLNIESLRVANEGGVKPSSIDIFWRLQL